MTTVPTAVAADTVPATPPIPSAPRRLDLRIVLIIMAALEVFDGLSMAWTVFGDPEVAVPGVSGAGIAIHPVLALAALLFAATGRVRHAIIVLGAVIIVTWLKYMPTVVSLGMDSVGPGAIWSPAQIIAFPLLAVGAIGFAVCNRRLGLATALVSIPSPFNVAALIAFAIGIAIRGV